MTAILRQWRAGLPNPALDVAIARLCSAGDVAHVAVMPDAHVADEVCVGTVTATTHRLLPAAVGSDIGCGMVTLRLGADADRLRNSLTAARTLNALARAIPPLMHSVRDAADLPHELSTPLSHSSLEALKRRDGRLEFGTLGRGNHFLELQRDQDNELWLAVHSGSRCMGPAIRRHHESIAERDEMGLAWLDVADPRGLVYLADLQWAARYAALNRRRIVERACDGLADVLHAEPVDDGWISSDHNHLRLEQHQGRSLWVHRKGAQRVGPEALGIVPGSMGSPSYHVEGRGVPEALSSAAHGAGRALSRSEARQRINVRELDSQMRGVWFDARLRHALREEAPSAYKDIGEVMRAQRELVRIVRRLEPVLVYKAV
jgi:tRNA-splicing ligase RtcB